MRFYYGFQSKIPNKIQAKMNKWVLWGYPILQDTHWDGNMFIHSYNAFISKLRIYEYQYYKTENKQLFSKVNLDKYLFWKQNVVLLWWPLSIHQVQNLWNLELDILSLSSAGTFGFKIFLYLLFFISWHIFACLSN